MPKKNKKKQEFAPILLDFLRHMRRYRDPAYSVPTRRSNERKGWETYNVMDAKTQRLALSLITLG